MCFTILDYDIVSIYYSAEVPVRDHRHHQRGGRPRPGARLREGATTTNDNNNNNSSSDNNDIINNGNNDRVRKRHGCPCSFWTHGFCHLIPPFSNPPSLISMPRSAPMAPSTSRPQLAAPRRPRRAPRCSSSWSAAYDIR